MQIHQTTEHAVVIREEVDLPRPTRPAHRSGFWAWLTRANVRAEVRHHERVAAWKRTGGKGERVIYMPRCQVHQGDVPGEFTIEALPAELPWTHVGHTANGGPHDG